MVSKMGWSGWYGNKVAENLKINRSSQPAPLFGGGSSSASRTGR
jgi:hypothetical protein